MEQFGTDARRVALALGGLAGSNAFGAGVLEAAYDLGVRPHLISATSGQIGWVHAYLERARGGRRLREILVETIAEVEKTGLRDIDATILAVAGVRGAFRPAWFELPLDLFENWASTWERLSSASRPHPSVIEALARLAPARLLVPEFPPQFFAAIAEAFAGTDVPVLFNSYSPADLSSAANRGSATRARVNVQVSGPWGGDTPRIP